MFDGGGTPVFEGGTPVFEGGTPVLDGGAPGLLPGTCGTPGAIVARRRHAPGPARHCRLGTQPGKRNDRPRDEEQF